MDCTNQGFRNALLEIVDNQLNTLDPPQTKETYDRLIAEGHSIEDARSLLAAAVRIEMTEMLVNMEPFNLERFTETLRELPQSLADREDEIEQVGQLGAIFEH